VSEHPSSEGALAVITAGTVIGAVEVVLAVSFAALVFGGYLVAFLANGIGLYLLAAALTLAILAWRAGARGVVGSVQDAAAAVLAIVATSTAVGAFGSPDRAFLSVVAATLVVTLLTGLTFFLLGTFRLGNLVRYVPYPVVGGFLAGTGWLLAKGGVGVAGSVVPSVGSLGQMMKPYELIRWVPAVVFGLTLVLVTRLVKRPVILPVEPSASGSRRSRSACS
jgi:SulP family sulfate permease